ncbi:MAG: FKBP-type peptidyl-prolyl cis-trans isomerase [Pirellulales bacterium]
MRRFAFVIAAVVCLSAWKVQAQEKSDAKAPPAKGKAPAAEKLVEEPDEGAALDTASYGIGANIGRGMKQDGIDINVDALVAGLKDALAGKEPKYTEAQLREAFGIVQRQLQTRSMAKLKALGDKNKQEGTAFLADNKKKEGVKSTASGLQYVVLKSGKGPSPKATDSVKTHYHGTLINGTVFDSSVDRGEPISFPVNGVIKGWTEALQLMKVGDKWKIFVPSELAYGERGAGQEIGPNSVLVFEIELLGIE